MTLHAPLWRWATDARVVRGDDNTGLAVNFATGSVVRLETAALDSVASISGLTFPVAAPDTLAPDVISALVDGGFLFPASDYANYDRDMVRSVAAMLEDTAGLIVMPTEKCNLRCTYCYESFEKGRMRPANVDAVKAAISRMADAHSDFSLGFFGGEPLLCSDIVLELSRHAFDARARRGRGYAAGITTNATLLKPELFRALLDAGVVSYQITLDGSRAVHDRQRVTVKGAGTFDEITARLIEMARSPLPYVCVLRCNVHDRDFDSVLALFDDGPLEALREDRRFIIDVHRIWQSDRKSIAAPSGSEGCLSGQQQALDYFKLNAELERRGAATVPFASVPQALGKSCYAGKPNWFVVGADLSLYKCTVAFDHPVNRIGMLRADGSLAIDAERHARWIGSNLTSDAGCGSCYLRVPCGGIACPLTRFTNGAKGCPDLRQAAELARWGAEMRALKPKDPVSA